MAESIVGTRRQRYRRHGPREGRVRERGPRSRRRADRTLQRRAQRDRPPRPRRARGNAAAEIDDAGRTRRRPRPPRRRTGRHQGARSTSTAWPTTQALGPAQGRVAEARRRADRAAQARPAPSSSARRASPEFGSTAQHAHVPARHDAQPVEPRTHARWFVRRIGGRGRRGDAADRFRVGRRRLDPHPCVRTPDSSARRARSAASRRATDRSRHTRRRSVASRAASATPHGTGTASSVRTSATQHSLPHPGLSATKRILDDPFPDGLRVDVVGRSRLRHQRERGRDDHAQRCASVLVDATRHALGRSQGRAQGHVRRRGDSSTHPGAGSTCATYWPDRAEDFTPADPRRRRRSPSDASRAMSSRARSSGVTRTT